MAAGEFPRARQIIDEVKFYVVWEQQWLLGHPAHHRHPGDRMGRQRLWLRLWLWQQLRLRLWL